MKLNTKCFVEPKGNMSKIDGKVFLTDSLHDHRGNCSMDVVFGVVIQSYK